MDDVEPIGPTVPRSELQCSVGVLCWVGEVTALQEPVDLLLWNGLGKEEPLCLGAFRVSQRLQLVRSLDTLCDDLKPEGLPKASGWTSAAVCTDVVTVDKNERSIFKMSTGNWRR